jgi:hypothetical protein
VRDSWTALDWEAYFDERAGVREYEGGFDRGMAERLAFEDTIAHWMSVHLPVATEPDRCVYCREAAVLDDTLLPMLAAAGNTWIHRSCWTGWEIKRRDEAIVSLRTMGLRAGSATA